MLKPLSKEDIVQGLKRLDELATEAGKFIEISVYGGAAIALAFNKNRYSYDIDFVINNKENYSFVEKIIQQVAKEFDWHENWMNDNIKVFIDLTKQEKLWPVDPFLNKEIGLVVQIPTPEYLLAMKCCAMRIDADTHDKEDIIMLIEECNLHAPQEVIDIVDSFFPRAYTSRHLVPGIIKIFEEIDVLHNTTTP